MKLKIALHNSMSHNLNFRLEPACQIHTMAKDSSLDLILEINDANAELELTIENDEIVAFENDGVFVNIYQDGKLLYPDG